MPRLGCADIPRHVGGGWRAGAGRYPYSGKAAKRASGHFWRFGMVGTAAVHPAHGLSAPTWRGALFQDRLESDAMTGGRADAGIASTTVCNSSNWSLVSLLTGAPSDATGDAGATQELSRVGGA